MTQEYIYPQEVPERMVVPEQPEEEGEEEEGDGLQDLFEVTTEDVMDSDNEDLSDLTDVSEDDLMGSPDGDISDLVDVSNEDIMGNGPQKPKPKYKIAPRGSSTIRRYPPPPTMGGQR